MNAPATNESSQQSVIRSSFVYGLAIFLSAFLLFQVQPLIAKIILPWFGGGAAVWLVCLVFFQAALLGGYLYSYLLTRHAPAGMQPRIHAVLLALSLLALPILPRAAWKPTPTQSPLLHILLVLAVSVGVPFFMLATTSPLLQAWYASSRANSSPYRLYAVSNIGSVVALLSYPVVFEPYIGSHHLAVAWSIAYAGSVILCGALALSQRRPASAIAETSEVQESTPSAADQILWLALAACGSALLLAITNHITQNVASVPFLWVLPLSLYLLSFILCFDVRGWYNRNLFLRLLGVALGGMSYALYPYFAGLPLKVLIPLHCLGLFLCCMVCHGELSRLKPHPSHLTRFYLMISLGGAIGAAFVAVIAPRIFHGFFELHVALGACAVLALIVNVRDRESVFYIGHKPPAWLVLAGIAIAIIVSLGDAARSSVANVRLMARNFYGVLRVYDDTVSSDVPDVPQQGPSSDDTRYRVLMNGTINHGLQLLAPGRRTQPTAYYARESGIGVVIESMSDRNQLRVGVVGLGVGTIATYGKPGDDFTFYEINPLDVQIAQSQFTFLRDSAAAIHVVMGDARLSLESETPRNFDILAVDAFSGDSIPVHLITREAFELYFRHIKPNGMLAMHVSNQYLDLVPVVRGAAAALHKKAVVVDSAGDKLNGVYRARWVLVGARDIPSGESDLPAAAGARNQQLLWTDDYNSLLKALK